MTYTLLDRRRSTDNSYFILGRFLEAEQAKGSLIRVTFVHSRRGCYLPTK
jgi:hypothetical protein